MTSEGKRRLIIGTRASALALWQTNFIAETLTTTFSHIACELRTFQTTGDDIVDRPLPELGGKGAFTARLEQALLAGDVDIAVHSLKDLPIETMPGLEVGAIVNRADARDVLVARDGLGFDALPSGARVGTSSLRRQAQLLRVRPDLAVAPIRGNVETRIRKVKNGEYDATVLAAAGLDRLGFGDAISTRFPLDMILPAPGQGALAVQCRAGDAETLRLLRAIDEPAVRRVTLAERSFLSALGGGCAAPVGAIAELDADGAIHMKGIVGKPDGTESIFVEASGADGAALAAELARQAIDRGARGILDAARGQMDKKMPLKGKRVVVTRAVEESQALCDALTALGATALKLPMIRRVPVVSEQTLAGMAGEAKRGDWLVFTSAHGVATVWPFIDTQWLRDMRVAAVGPRTAAALEAHSVKPDFVPEHFTGEEAARRMPDVSNRRVWLLRAEVAGDEILRILGERGAVVHDIPVYRTEGEAIDAKSLSEFQKGVDVVTFTSGSTARSFQNACRKIGWRADRGVVIACIGPVTAKVARDAGLHVDVIAEEHTTSGLVDALIEHFSEVVQ